MARRQRPAVRHREPPWDGSPGGTIQPRNQAGATGSPTRMSPPGRGHEPTAKVGCFWPNAPTSNVMSARSRSPVTGSHAWRGTGSWACDVELDAADRDPATEPVPAPPTGDALDDDVGTETALVQAGSPAAPATAARLSRLCSVICARLAILVAGRGPVAHQAQRQPLRMSRKRVLRKLQDVVRHGVRQMPCGPRHRAALQRGPRRQC